MDDAITIESLSKAYRIESRDTSSQSLVESVFRRLRSPWKHFERLRSLDTFRTTGNEENIHWALRDINLRVPQGDVLGVIGHNGAGKSTLLKVLSRITLPTTGRAIINGRVSSLLEVGTGFHPELSGRDNIYLNGTILGMRSREIDQRFKEIVDFSGLEKFLETPIKRYSSGMKVRLAFAVAAHLEPEILIIDEVLAVGDQEFQNRCLGKMHDVARGGRTVIFVSHQLSAVKSLCRSCVLMDQGRIKMQGEPTEVINRYIASGPATELHGSRWVRSATATESQPIVVTEVCSMRGEQPAQEFDCEENVVIAVQLEVRRAVAGLYAYINIFSSDGTLVYEGDNRDYDQRLFSEMETGTLKMRIGIPPRTLAPGRYRVYLSLSSPTDVAGPQIDSPGWVNEFTLTDSSTPRGNRRQGYLSKILQWTLAEENAVQPSHHREL